MNIIRRKLSTRLFLLARTNVFFFSKDPFDKFNRKKTSNSSVDQQSDRRQTHQKGKNQHLNADKKASRRLDEEEKKHSFTEKDQTDNVKKDKFSKFKGKKTQKEEISPQKKQQNVAKMEPATEVEEKEKSASQAKGFQKFVRRKGESKEEQKPEKREKKDEFINDDKIKSQRPEIKKLKIQSDKKDEEEEPAIYLRKPKTINKFKKQPSLYEQERMKEEKASAMRNNQKQTPKEEEDKKMQENSGEERNTLWKQFQKLIEQARHRAVLMNQPRHKRQHLIKTPPQESTKQEPKTSGQPLLSEKYFIRMIGAGLGLALASFFWGSPFSSAREKEVGPEYLRSALSEERVEQTWVSYVDIEDNNDQNAKGKNVHKFIFIRQTNGEVSFCVSNNEFEALWFGMVQQHNDNIYNKTPQFYHGQNGQMLAKSQVPPRKVVINERREAKTTSAVSNLKSALSLLLLFYFVKSIMQVSKGAKGKGVSSMFQKEKSFRFQEKINVTFKDVVGMQKAKEEIVQFIDFLKHPKKYSQLGARIPKGALLTGPPGTGKTMLAKACAGESNVPFFTISGSEFIEMYVGVGAQRVRNLFEEAKKNSPSIIFIDEIDAVGKKRTGGFGGGNDERDTTLNQLLVEMDGFDSHTNVIVFAATNQKEVLDAALTRPGRFDRLIDIDLPDLQGRKQIFQVHLKPLKLDERIDIADYARRLATLTPGFSGADIKNVCNEAAIIAARNNKESVSIMDFQLATERIIGGVERKSQLITEETRKTVAYHQCGHGVVSWFLKYSSPLLKLTIIPRSKGALGFAQYLPNEHQMYTKAKLLDEICVILGGRISEETFFGKVSTGAADDLNKAYQIAKTIVTQYGFGDKLGWMHFEETEYAKEYSREVENKIDAEIIEIIKLCTNRTRKLVSEKKEVIGRLAERLLENETIDQTIIEEILGERPFGLSKQHQDYIKEKKQIAEDIKKHAADKLKEAEKDLSQQQCRSDFVL